MTTLFAGFWLVKAQNTPGSAVCRRTQGGLSSKLHLCVELGGRPLVILATAASAIGSATS